MNEWYMSAKKKLEEERKSGKYDKYAAAMKDAVCEALDSFCRQDGEFAQAVVQGGTFEDCMKAVARNCGSAISDLEAFCRGIRADYSYDRPSRTATAVYRGVTLTVTADSSTALVDGAPFEMPLSAQRSGLSLAVPADLLAQAWDLELVQDIREDGSVGSYTVYPGLT